MSVRTNKAVKKSGGLPIGKNVLIRTVTHYYTGKLVCAADGFFELHDVAWIADTGRFSQALKTGTLNEVEPMGGPVFVSIGAVVDISIWVHPLPLEMK